MLNQVLVGIGILPKKMMLESMIYPYKFSKTLQVLFYLTSNSNDLNPISKFLMSFSMNLSVSPISSFAEAERLLLYINITSPFITKYDNNFFQKLFKNS